MKKSENREYLSIDQSQQRLSLNRSRKENYCTNTISKGSKSNTLLKPINESILTSNATSSSTAVSSSDSSALYESEPNVILLLYAL